MSVKNILVHLDGALRTAARLHLALDLARRHGARLVGMFAQNASAYRVGVVTKWPSAEYAAAAAASGAMFAEATRGYDQAEWVDLNRGSEQQILERMTDIAHAFDLVVAGQHQDTSDHGAPADLIPQLVLESGRPVLVVPHSGSYERVGRRPLIAWNNSRSAARALNDALGLFEPECEAVLATIGAPNEPSSDKHEAIIRHLSCHKISARVDTLFAQDIGVMDLLLNRSADHSADLLVAGAFGQAGFPGLSSGSGTRFLLRHMTLPVLLAH